jgi:hypothetical protein
MPQVVRGGPLELINHCDYPIDAPIHFATSGSVPSVRTSVQPLGASAATLSWVLAEWWKTGKPTVRGASSAITRKKAGSRIRESADLLAEFFAPPSADRD